MRTKLLLAVVLVAVSASCATFKPQTIEESIGATIATITALKKQLGAEVVAGTIELERAEDINSILNSSYSATILAEQALKAGRPETALEYLQVASTILTQIEEMLR